ncbi:MAG: TetR/AcrR family transcriptional regulator [Betaproteobacteria bacterium]|nr:TetR/AcrR family transcriptional regulator [Betaproteobacteria bacterium]
MATAKGVASRERMLDAAIGLMRHGGLAAAGMNEIVAASGAPKGSVYHHFPDGKRLTSMRTSRPCGSRRPQPSRTGAS